MPIYEYECESCGVSFECILSVDKRNEPCESKCDECGGNIRKKMSVSALSADATLTPDKATGGRWNELMDRMKSAPGIGKNERESLDRTKSNSGRRWKG